ncbi:hypothetical protein R1flu_001481 [Riccia fluitans]|uniref:Phage tail protein n=1 Tax=Riccia fluitans TaxID=41844 RepID=A0ABD1Y3E1_9MARC
MGRGKKLEILMGGESFKVRIRTGILQQRARLEFRISSVDALSGARRELREGWMAGINFSLMAGVKFSHSAGRSQLLILWSTIEPTAAVEEFGVIATVPASVGAQNSQVITSCWMNSVNAAWDVEDSDCWIQLSSAFLFSNQVAN